MQYILSIGCVDIFSIINSKGKANAVQTKLYEFFPILIVITLIFGYVLSEELSYFGASVTSHFIFYWDDALRNSTN